MKGGLITFKALIIFFEPYPHPTLNEANPNNPTGTYLTKKEVLELRKKLNKNILLVIDDAYAEYMKNSDYVSGLDLFIKTQFLLTLDLIHNYTLPLLDSLLYVSFSRH